MKGKRFLVLAIAASLFSQATLAVEKSKEQATVKMIVGNWAVEPLTPIVEKFEKDTGIDVDIQGFPFRDMLQTIEVRAKAKATDVDVIFVDAPLVPSYAVRGILQPLNQYLTEDEAKAKWTKSSIDAMSWDNKFWSMPLNNSSQVLYYNKDLLAKAGIPEPSTNPEHRITWEQLIEASKISMAKNPDTWGMSFGQVSRYYQLEVLPYSLGGGTGITDKGRVDVTNDAWLKAGQFYSDLFNKDKISPKGVLPEQTPQLFTSNEVAFFISGMWDRDTFTKAGVNYGMALHPAFEGYEPATPTNSWNLGVWKYSPNADASAKLVKYLTENNDVAISYTKTYGQTPASLAAITYVNENSEFDTFPANGLRLATYEAEYTAVARAKTPAYLEFEEMMNNAFEDIRNGTDVETSLGEAQSRISASLRRYR